MSERLLLERNPSPVATPPDDHFERRRKRNDGYKAPPSPRHRTLLTAGVVAFVVLVATAVTALFALH
jgi:hypothetical protein